MMLKQNQLMTALLIKRETEKRRRTGRSGI